MDAHSRNASRFPARNNGKILLLFGLFELSILRFESVIFRLGLGEAVLEFGALRDQFRLGLLVCMKSKVRLVQILWGVKMLIGFDL